MPNKKFILNGREVETPFDYLSYADICAMAYKPILVVTKTLPSGGEVSFLIAPPAVKVEEGMVVSCIKTTP
jgi:hypothetical protein